MKSLEREVLRRLPLAEAVLLLFEYVLNQEFLQECFEQHRGRCYEKDLTFASLVYLVRDALLEHDGSGRASFERAEQDQELEASIAATYGKLSRLPIPLSLALLRQATGRLGDLLPALPDERPASLRGLRVMVMDGKTIKNATRRLKLLRKVRGKLVGGKLLVALDLGQRLAVAMNADPDGHRNDVPLVPGLLEQIDRDPPTLWVIDRQFCDGKLPSQLGPLVVRYNRGVHFEPDPARPVQTGQDRQGRPYRQEWGWLGKDPKRDRPYVRRIWLERGEGQEDVILLTNLLDAQVYPAEDLLEIYLQRWSIERVFQQVTEVFSLQTLIGSSPQAMIFQASFCLLLYNLIQVVRGYVAQAASEEVESVQEVSTEKLFEDVQRELIGWSLLGDVEQVQQDLECYQTAGQVRRRLKQLLKDVWRPRWRKAPAKKYWRATKKGPGKQGPKSVWKILQKHKRGAKGAQRGLLQRS